MNPARRLAPCSAFTRSFPHDMHNGSPRFRGLRACWILALTLGFIGAFVPLPAALAQSTKIFVASFGNDANDGSRGAPKRNFQAAHDAVAAGGEVVALDTAGYGAMTITKSVGITAPAGITGFITVTSGDAVAVNAASTDTVILRGLTLNSPTGVTIGVAVSSVGTLEVNSCVLNGFNNNSGINLFPSSAVTCLVKNSTVRDCSTGISVSNFATGAIKLVIDGCRLKSNVLGVNVGAATSFAQRVELRDTLVTATSNTGVRVNGANNRVVLQGCTLSGNTAALALFDSGATAKLDNCVVTNNTTGLNRIAGANLLSRGNNTVENNGTDGTFSGNYSAK